ncbi:MAG: VWA domain-containing protein [Candidatus Heimdallarchaeum aukensis]|uniref:VWA domain-containing protein n=1 Tax=Candidatus Heimdallarchaeum aukensis TaxID=2876573 RepID=A0A9Y1BJF5_9ARCH|nr:MAG: VWA domain-containing protein [Candidatus Heimdallarchaeum aukensis]
MDKNKLLEAEIVSGKRNPSVYSSLSDGMSFYEIKKQTELAIDVNNMPAIQGLAISNKFAVAEALNSKKGYTLLARRAAKGDSSAPELFFMLRTAIDDKMRPIFRRLARQVILKTAYGITGQGIRGEVFEQTEFEPGLDEFDIDETLERFLQNRSRILHREDIVALERKERLKTAVLIFDTSGSLYGEKFTTAALAVAVMAYNLARDNFSVVLFNTKATVIKRMKERVRTDELVNRILESESAGYTNIAEGLKYGGLELEKIKRKNKFGILITDGAFNRGGDPRKYLMYYPKLHVIALPSKHDWGTRLCKDLARLGRGKFAEIKSYNSLPRVLMRLLKQV